MAITIAYDDPNAESDLAKYRAEYNLPECTKANGCFQKLNQRGEEGNYPAPNASWAGETSLDLDMVSAICPKCHIILIEANDNTSTNLYPAVERAVELGAVAVSNSWAGDEYYGEIEDDHYFNHPGTPILFASGDWGYSVSYPAASQYVIAVGGTSLKKATNTRGWTESAWNEAGSGCSTYESKPSWQKDPACSRRTLADISAVADPNTPVSVYDSYKAPGWRLVGGTSVATPLMAGVEALSSGAIRAAGPEAFPYVGQSGQTFDPVEGETASCASYLCRAGVGYDGPTGWGTPNGTFSLPTAVTESASVVPTSKATLHGSVRPGGVETKYRFEYGESKNYGTSVPVPDKSVGSGNSYVEVSQTIEGLKPQRTYHYRLTAVNGSEAHGVDRTFGTSPPSVTTGTASQIGAYKATLAGTINPEGSTTSYYFEYGPTTSYGKKMPLGPEEVGSGLTSVAVSTTVERLEANRTYHYRIVGVNSAGTTTGTDNTFKTAPAEWRAERLPHPPESSSYSQAFGISCLQPDSCVAVGDYWRLGSYHTAVTLAEKWNGEVWTVMSTPNPPGLEEGYLHGRKARLTSVSCSSAGACMAVGWFRGTSEMVAPISEVWNGGEWELTSVPTPIGGNEAQLLGVTCASATGCEAVGQYVDSGGEQKALVEGWSGTQWVTQAMSAPAESTQSSLSGVSCSAVTACTAVGSYRDASGLTRPLVERWNGVTWSEQTPWSPAQASAGLDGVSCVGPGNCTAVGDYQSGVPYVPLAEHWNGTSWSKESTARSEQEGILTAVDCLPAGYCTASGVYFSKSSGDEGWRSIIERLEEPPLWSELEIAPPGWWPGETYWHEEVPRAISCPEALVCAAVGESITAPKGELGVMAAFAEQTQQPVEAATGQATWTSQTEATLSGTIDSHGAETGYYFEYGLTSAYGQDSSPGNFIPGTGPVEIEVSGLSPGTTYHFRIVAENPSGTVVGSDQTFSTIGKPSVETGDVSGITATGGTLNGEVNPRGLGTTYYFEYGATEAYGSKTAGGNAGSGTANTSVSDVLGTLSPGTTYHYRLVATNLLGTTNGADRTFVTPLTFGAVFGGSGSGAGQLAAPNATATDAAGDVWVADTSHNRVQEFNSKGEFIRQFGTAGSADGLFSSPKGIAVNQATGNVYV
ncbi:MAG: hypothetical protein ACM3JL_01265, partial [Nitrososphaerota archaeon]